MTYKTLSPSYYRQRVPADRWWGGLLYWALGPVSLIGIISSFLVLVNFYFAFRVHPFSSDDVILQNALLYWKPFHHSTYYGDAGASYVDRLPLYWLVSRILSPGRHALFVDGIILATGNFVLFYWSAIYLLKKAGLRITYLTLVPFLWLSSFGYAVSVLFVETSMHNIEAGIIVAICALATKIYCGEFRPLASWKTIALTLLCALALGCTIVGDRYIIYYGLLPILVYAVVGFICIQQTVARRRIALLFGAILLCFVSAIIVQLLLSKAGVDFQSGLGAQTPQFVSYGLFFINVASTIYDLFILFGANFWGGDVIAIATISAIINSIFLLLILRSAVRYFRVPKPKPSKADSERPLQLMGALLLWSIAILTVSSIGGSGTYHYFVLLPFIGTILLVDYLSKLHGRTFRLMAMLLIVATALNVLTNFHDSKALANISGGVFSTFNQANSFDTDIVHALEAHGLTGSKGYSNYWQANGTSYLSGGKLDVLPALCTDSGQTVVYKWLMTSSQLTRPTSKTFFMFNTHYLTPPTCTMSNVFRQYGTPAQIFSTDGVTVYIYNRDIIAPLQ